MRKLLPRLVFLFLIISVFLLACSLFRPTSSIESNTVHAPTSQASSVNSELSLQIGSSEAHILQADSEGALLSSVYEATINDRPYVSFFSNA